MTTHLGFPKTVPVYASVRVNTNSTLTLKCVRLMRSYIIPLAIIILLPMSFQLRCNGVILKSNLKCSIKDILSKKQGIEQQKEKYICIFIFEKNKNIYYLLERYHRGDMYMERVRFLLYIVFCIFNYTCTHWFKPFFKKWEHNFFIFSTSDLISFI